MPKRTLLHEWMHRFDLKDSVVRVWTKPQATNHNSALALRIGYASQAILLKRVIDANNKTKPFNLFGFGVKSLVEQLANEDFVAAVEHLDRKSGNGRLVYVDWP